MRSSFSVVTVASEKDFKRAQLYVKSRNCQYLTFAYYLPTVRLQSIFNSPRIAYFPLLLLNHTVLKEVALVAVVVNVTSWRSDQSRCKSIHNAEMSCKKALLISAEDRGKGKRETSADLQQS